jgi:hypothetical protein
MTEVALTKWRIEEGKEERLREWVDELRTREDEAVETLEDENAFTEAAFIEHGDDANYLVYFLEAADLETAIEEYEHSDRDIDERNRAVMDEVVVDDEDGTEFEPLYRFHNPDRP